MNFLNYQSHLKILLKNFKSCSLVNADGALLYSKDNSFELLTTTRLVAFQIVKKYLNPKPQDLFILNDPENGGYQYSKIVFITCLNPNLFLIWDEDYHFIDFKIPPTPLFDQGRKNEFVWQAMISANKNADELEAFFEYQKYTVDRLMHLVSLIEDLANSKSQQIWLKASNEVFNTQFNNKAHGTAEAYFKLNSTQTIKLKFSAEEKQNLKLITLDFTNTNLATDIHTSSHVIESALIKKISEFFQIGDYLTQAVLDKIKVILPPRSIVSKPHPAGLYNYELQTICSQVCEHNMTQLNAHNRKGQNTFDYANFLNFEVYGETLHANNLISATQVSLQNFEQLICKNLIKMTAMKKTDSSHHIIFSVCTDNPLKLNIKNNYYSDKLNNQFKLNDQLLQRGSVELKKNDRIEIIWG
ncbi:hypothetical protein K2P97_12340 [bacterium]|nr:hypothetical protein [bacterium]